VNGIQSPQNIKISAPHLPLPLFYLSGYPPLTQIKLNLSLRHALSTLLDLKQSFLTTMPPKQANTAANGTGYTLTANNIAMIRAVLCSLDEVKPDFKKVTSEFGIGKGGHGYVHPLIYMLCAPL
jgi:hypothetical protein